MDKQKAEKNIKLWYWYQMFKEPILWGPIIIIFLTRLTNMDLSQIYVLEAVCVLGFIVLEVPSGALADLIGRKKTVVIGMSILAAKMFIWASADCPVMVWIANLGWIVGISLISGADISMMYDTLKFLDRESEFKKIQGRAMAFRFGLVAVGCIASGYLAEINLRIPICIDVLFIILACAVSYGFTDPPVGDRKKYNWREHWQIMKISILFVANNARVKWVIAFLVAIGTVSKIWFFTYNPYFELVELPLSCFGWVFCFYNVVASLSSYRADWISKKLGDFGSIIMMILFLGVPILIMGLFVGQLVVLVAAVQNIVRGYIDPFMGQFLQQHLNSENRATVTSIKSAVGALVQFVFMIIFAWILGVMILPECLQILGLFSIFIGVILIIFYQKIFR